MHETVSFIGLTLANGMAGAGAAIVADRHSGTRSLLRDIIIVMAVSSLLYGLQKAF